MVEVIGHRGAAQVCTENTLASFRRGMDDGAAAIELDVQRSRDGHLVLIHDAAVDRVAVAGRTTGAVAELTWAQLQEVELEGGQRIPDLASALELIDIPMEVEIKARAAAAPTAQMVLARGAGTRVTMTSFDVESLRIVHAAAPQLPLGVISHEPTPAALDAVRELSARVLALKIAHLDAPLVRRLQGEGVLVGGWAVRSWEDLRLAVAAGVDRVTADDPGWCREALATLV
ncbi:MAG TPA: glycerophosphodiester phosphodiesterase [Ruania sp.]|nr:glycerophosphodiester phosphodiesterase [Ruania sp.]